MNKFILIITSIFSVLFGSVLILLPICSIFFDKNVEHIIGFMVLFAILFLACIFCSNICKLIIKKNKIELLKKVFFNDKELQIDDNKKEIFKIFCNTLIEL